MHHLRIPLAGCSKQDHDPCSDPPTRLFLAKWSHLQEAAGMGRSPNRRAEAGPASLSWGKEQERALPSNPPSKCL